MMRILIAYGFRIEKLKVDITIAKTNSNPPKIGGDFLLLFWSKSEVAFRFWRKLIKNGIRQNTIAAATRAAAPARKSRSSKRANPVKVLKNLDNILK